MSLLFGKKNEIRGITFDNVLGAWTLSHLWVPPEQLHLGVFYIRISE